jgi:hypothetical protein
MYERADEESTTQHDVLHDLVHGLPGETTRPNGRDVARNVAIAARFADQDIGVTADDRTAWSRIKRTIDRL